MSIIDKKIDFLGRELDYQIRRHRWAKHIRLSIRPCFWDEDNCSSGSKFKILVTLPKRVDDQVAEKFILEKREWILGKIKDFEDNRNKTIPTQSETNYKKERIKAKRIISNRVQYFANLYGFEFNKIAIRSQRTRWGSCSKDKNLNFNYKLIYLSREIMDYVIVHELCHLDQFNHSKRFWFLVSEIIPNYRELRRELKKITI